MHKSITSSSETGSVTSFYICLFQICLTCHQSGFCSSSPLSSLTPQNAVLPQFHCSILSWCFSDLPHFPLLFCSCRCPPHHVQLIFTSLHLSPTYSQINPSISEPNSADVLPNSYTCLTSLYPCSGYVTLTPSCYSCLWCHM